MEMPSVPTKEPEEDINLPDVPTAEPGNVFKPSSHDAEFEHVTKFLRLGVAFTLYQHEKM